MSRRDLRDSSPAEWCLHAETRGALADRAAHVITRHHLRGSAESAAGEVTVRSGPRIAVLTRAPGDDGVWGHWGWAAACNDGAHRDPEAALRWVLSCP